MMTGRTSGRWGRQRPIHKYLNRFWHVPSQEWRYVYPEAPQTVGGSMQPGEDPEDAVRRTAGEDELDYRRQAQAADDMESAAAQKTKPAGPEKDESNDPEYLHGFEEGYELGKRVKGAEDRAK